LDPEYLKFIQLAVEKGILASGWVALLIAVVGAGVGAFLGSYLKEKAKN